MSITDGSGAETAYGYEANGQLASVSYPNGASAAYAYGPAGQTMSVTNTAAGGSAVVGLTYGYDADLNVVSITDQNSEVATYGYDDLERLTSETAPANFEVEGAPAINQNFGYDADGNRTSLTVNAGDTTGAVSSTYNYNPEVDELATAVPASGSSTTYCYDDDGQLQASTVGSTTGDCTTGTITSFSYDPEGNLVGAGGDTYIYDAAGDRVSETESGVTTTQVFDPDTDDVIQQTVGASGSDVVTTNYEYGANGLVSADPSTDTDDADTVYYGEDALGSVVDLTSATGAATDEYAYDAFGQNLAHNGTSVQPFTFMGNQTDMTTGLDNFNAREYDPALGSFLSEDPVSGNPEDPTTLDAYLYGVDNPFADPDSSGMANQADSGDFLQSSSLLGAGRLLPAEW
jgi:RHS repeat-associated protein